MNPSYLLTRIPAIISLLTVVGNTITMVFDGNHETNPDWNMVISTATVAIGVLFARPDKVTSEQAGAK